ncbi:MAG: HD-GYP domain-containing protein [Pirellulales bacterium]|nr:HD-GYP domain-containing protein [Pirellulales bacterium]
MTSQLAQLVEENLSPSAVRAHAALRSALECPLELWKRLAPRQWELRSPPCNENGVEHTDLAGLCDQRLVALLERAHATGRPCRATIAVEWVAVAAPIIEENGEPGVVAVAEVESTCGLYAERLADSVLRELRQRDEVDWLRDENFVFSQQVTDDFEELTYLRQMATQLVVKDTSLDIFKLVAQTIGGLREMIGAESVYFVRPGPKDRPEVVQTSCYSPEEAECVDPHTVARLADMHCERAAVAPCVKNDIRNTDAAARSAGVRQFLMVPVSTGARSFGWFVAINRRSVGRQWPPSPLLQLGHDEFGTWEASLLSAAATLVASHAANLDLIREKEILLTNTVRTLVSALDSKDAYTRGHSERVALFSKRIAENMGYDEAATEKLYLSGLLHDVGKIGVSDAVLRKPDKLTPEEYEEIKRHPDDGWAILRDLEQLNYLLPGVLHHHEQVNGTGYPDGLKGDEIPLDARIMAVADAYDAMTSDRAYRQGIPHEKAIEILKAGAGSQWDAGVLEAFLAAIEDITAIRYGYSPAERPERCGPALSPSCRD